MARRNLTTRDAYFLESMGDPTCGAYYDITPNPSGGWDALSQRIDAGIYGDLQRTGPYRTKQEAYTRAHEAARLIVEN